LPLMLLSVIVFKKLKLSVKLWLLFVVICLALNSPYLYYEFTNNFSNIRALFLLAGGDNIYLPISTRLVEYFGFWLSPAILVNPMFDIVDIIGYKFVAALGILCLPIIYFLRFDIKNPKTLSWNLNLTPIHNLRFVLWLWFLVPSIVLLLPMGSTFGLRLYYFFTLCPLIFFIYGLGWLKLLQKQYIRTAYYLAAVFFLLQAFQIIVFYKFIYSLK